MRKELPKFFEQILNITEPWYIEKIEQQDDIITCIRTSKKVQSLNTTVNIIQCIRYGSKKVEALNSIPI